MIRFLGSLIKYSILIIGFFIYQTSFSQPPKELKPILEVAGNDSGAALGYYVKGVGDLNKDGYADVAVSAPYAYKTYIYFGGRPMSNKPALTLEGGGKVVSGDFNGDGWIDLAIEKWLKDTIFIYYGGTVMDSIPDIILHSPQSAEHFGFNIASGDINGDKIDDLIIAATSSDYLDTINYLRGKIYIYSGGTIFDTIPRLSISGDTLRAGLAWDLASGDVNGDGQQDIIALGYNQQNYSVSKKFYYISVYLSDSLFQLKRNNYIDSRYVPGSFSDHVQSFDADSGGVDDILVNKIYVFKGGAHLDSLPAYYIPPPNNDTTNYGPYPWVSGGGDYNGDGVKDILLSATQGYWGGVYGFVVMLGRPGSPGHYAAYRIFSQCCGQYKLTGRPENAGDVNGDGIDDIIIGAPSEPIDSVSGFFGIYSGDTSLVVGVKDDYPRTSKGYSLQQNYPNPFNPITTIKYQLPVESRVRLTIYNVIGQAVTTLVEEIESAGYRSVTWDASRVAAGLYLYRLDAISIVDHISPFKQIEKMLLIK